jgi:hypothetical protein
MVLAGNYSADSTRGIIKNAFPGHDLQIYRGFARITTTPAISWPVIDEATDQQMIITASGAALTSIIRVEFNLERSLSASNGDRLKLGRSYSDDSGSTVQTPIAANGLLSATPAIRSDLFPIDTVSIPYTPLLVLSRSNSLAPVGTLALAVGSRPSFLVVPVRIFVLRPTAIISSRDLDLSREMQQQTTVIN